MRRNWSVALLAVALVGAIVWGNLQARQRVRLAQNVENRYGQSFHNLSWTTENLTDQLGQLQVSGSLERQQRILGDIRVHASHAVDAMAGLPLVNAPLKNTQAYLNDLNQTADQYAYQVGQGSPLSAEQMKYLGDLQKRAGMMESELHDMTGLLDNGRIRWSDLAAAQAIHKDGEPTPILHALGGMDNGLAPDQGKAPGVKLDTQTNVDLGAQVQPTYALDQVRKFMDTPLKQDPKIVQTQDPHDKDLPIPMFVIDAVKSTNTPVQVGVSMKGGHVIYMLDGRPMAKAAISAQAAETRARALLKRLGYPEVAMLDYDQPDGQALMTFAPLQDKTLLIPDTIEVTVALDNGEVLGFNAKQYWLNHRLRKLTESKLSAEQAKAKLAKGVKIVAVQPAIFTNDQREEVNAWCFTVAVGNNDQYRIYINANTGVEEGIQRLVERVGHDK